MCRKERPIVLQRLFPVPRSHTQRHYTSYHYKSYLNENSDLIPKDHSSNKTAQVTAMSVLKWQRTFDDVGHKNRLRAPSMLCYGAPISDY